MSPVPPATSMQRTGPLEPARRRETKESFQRRWTPSDMASFMTSYLDATEANTPRTSSSFDSSGTVRKPKCVVPLELEGAASVVFLFGGDDGSAFVCRLRMRANGRRMLPAVVDGDSAWAVR